MDYDRLEKDVVARLRKELSPELLYHQVEHTLEVIKAAEQIGRGEGVSEDELKLLKTAAVLHDSGFLECPCLNEPLACEIADKILPEYGYTPEQIKMIDGMIMSTAIPQTPQCFLGKILCDADLSYLGGDEALPHTDNLRTEMSQALNRKFTDLEWVDFQLMFLNKHEFFTAYARKKFGAGKKRYVAYLNAQKKALEKE